MNVKELRSKIEQIKGRRDTTADLLNENKNNIEILKKELSYSEKALEIIQKAALQTQSGLKFNIETPVSTALGVILEDPYKFGLKFDIKRDRTSCKLLFNRNGNPVDPMNSSGGTALDVASIALRQALHQIAVNKTDNVIIGDEIFKHVSADRRVFTGELISTICRELNMQYILVSHDQQHLVSHANKVFRVSMKDGVSTVT